MQLLAKDREKKIIHADQASKNINYKCLECDSSVRLRGGLHRRKHFYHILPNRVCLLSGKSLIHLQTQCHIQNLLPAGEAFLERRFDSINRIADVCWEKEKIIFEVQCSSITAEEVKARNRDYKTLGYQVVWILHDLRYNSTRLTEIEIFLLESPHYYANIDAEGKGNVYDQISWLESSFKRKKGERVFVNLSIFHKIVDSKIGIRSLKLRENKWSIYFKGDLLDCGYQKTLSDTQIEQLEKGNYNRRISKARLFLQLTYDWIKEGYLNFLNMMIESACR